MNAKQQIAAVGLAKAMNRFTRKNPHALVLAHEIKRLMDTPTMQKMVLELREFLIVDEESKSHMKGIFTPAHKEVVEVEMLLFKLVTKFHLGPDGSTHFGVAPVHISVDDCLLFNSIDKAKPGDFEDK